MSHEVFQKQVYAGLFEIVKDKKLYYQSGIDTKYNKFTEEGEKAVLEYLKMMAPHMLEREETNLRQLSKDLVWGELKS